MSAFLDQLALALAEVPGFVGIIEYGSRARGSNIQASDVDWIVVLERPYRTVRVHSRNLDLNFLALADLQALVLRVSKHAQHPWDTMLEGCRIIDDRAGQLAALLGQLHDGFQVGDSLSEGEVNGFRFLAARLTAEARRFQDDALLLRLTVDKLLLCLLTYWHVSQGQWWQGFKDALARLREQDVALYQLFSQSINAHSLDQTLERLGQIAERLFADVGGWDGSALLVDSWLQVSAAAAEPIPPQHWRRIVALLNRDKDGALHDRGDLPLPPP